MPIILTCPSCGMQMQVLEEHLGRRVQCPSCGNTFTAATEIGAGPAPATSLRRPYADEQAPPPPRSERREYHDYPEYEDNRWRRRRERGVRDAVAGPAIALMVVAIIGLVGGPLSFVFFALGGSGAFAGDRVRGQQEAMSDAAVGVLGMVAASTAIAVSIVMLMGALRMQKLQSYGLALTGSILAMIPLLSPCCLLGLPFGIWSLTVLNRDDVKRAFS